MQRLSFNVGKVVSFVTTLSIIFVNSLNSGILVKWHQWCLCVWEWNFIFPQWKMTGQDSILTVRLWEYWLGISNPSSVSISTLHLRLHRVASHHRKHSKHWDSFILYSAFYGTDKDKTDWIFRQWLGVTQTCELWGVSVRLRWLVPACVAL